VCHEQSFKHCAVAWNAAWWFIGLPLHLSPIPWQRAVAKIYRRLEKREGQHAGIIGIDAEVSPATKRGTEFTRKK
jgi:hypothetical protein